MQNVLQYIHECFAFQIMKSAAHLSLNSFCNLAAEVQATFKNQIEAHGLADKLTVLYRTLHHRLPH